ncbi:unnamed protein product [Calypogeia fissa]
MAMASSPGDSRRRPDCSSPRAGGESRGAQERETAAVHNHDPRRGRARPRKALYLFCRKTLLYPFRWRMMDDDGRAYSIAGFLCRSRAFTFPRVLLVTGFPDYSLAGLYWPSGYLEEDTINYFLPRGGASV